MMPVLRRLPIDVLYPTGKKQEERQPRFSGYFEKADIVGGDFLHIWRFMPDQLPGKIIITNTVTSQDIAEMKERGVKILVTTTPEMNNRSFGTNVLQAVFVAYSGKEAPGHKARRIFRADERLNIKPRVVRLWLLTNFSSLSGKLLY